MSDGTPNGLVTDAHRALATKCFTQESGRIHISARLIADSEAAAVKRNDEANTTRLRKIVEEWKSQDTELVADRDRTIEELKSAVTIANAATETMRLNGCEAVRRSEEAANSDRQVLAAVTQGLRTEFQEGDTWDETDLLENWEVFFAHHKALEAKLAAETALREAADANLARKMEVIKIRENQLSDATIHATKSLDAQQETDEARFKAEKERDALAAQVAMLRDRITTALSWLPNAIWAEKCAQVLTDAIAATAASASVELRITSSPTAGFWLHIKTPSGLQAGIALGELKNSIALRALAEVASMPGHALSEVVKCGGAELTSLPVAELMAAREDTARLDWLEANNSAVLLTNNGVTKVQSAFGTLGESVSVRAAIDAARNATP